MRPLVVVVVLGGACVLAVAGWLLGVWWGKRRVLADSARRDAELLARQARAATADRVAVIGMLTSGIGHEINNPLTVILANLEFLGESLRNADPMIADAIRDAHAAAASTAEIVQNMRVFAQSRAASPGADVKRVVESTLKVVTTELRGGVELDIAETPAVALAGAELGQVLLHLLAHAAKVERRDPTRIRIAVTHEAPHVRIVITDPGQSIAADVVPHVFEPFFTTKLDGLGLWVCHEIVTAAGGTITVTSTEASGTTFRIELPVATQAACEHASSAPDHGRKRARLLVIDDDPVVGRSIVRLVRDRHDLVVLDSALLALAEIEAGKHFDVILCDLMMPVMNGVEFYDRLRVLAPEYADRVIFMTGGTFTAQTSELARDPSRPLLDKPFPVDELESLIQQVIEPTRALA